jgi:NADH-quinone oxidoreductase subunit M
MLPETAAALALPLAAVGVVSVVYGALLAMAQTDLKRIVAYSSISSMGYVVIGLAAYTSYSVGGAAFQMVSHGLISALMFTVVGVVYHKTGTRKVGEISGLAHRAPLVAGVFVAASFAYMGLPGMSGFPAELFVFLGGMGSTTVPYAPLVVAVAMFGIVLVAGYLLFAMQRVLFGGFRVGRERAAADGGAAVTDASLSDAVPMLVLLTVILVLGLQPDLVYDTVETSTASVAELVGGGS